MVPCFEYLVYVNGVGGGLWKIPRNDNLFQRVYYRVGCDVAVQRLRIQVCCGYICFHCMWMRFGWRIGVLGVVVVQASCYEEVVALCLVCYLVLWWVGML